MMQVCDSADLIDHVFYNNVVSKIVVSFGGIEVKVFGCWLPFDDKSDVKLAIFKHILSILEFELVRAADKINIVVGDFNADLKRDIYIISMQNEIIDLIKQLRKEQSRGKAERNRQCELFWSLVCG